MYMEYNTVLYDENRGLCLQTVQVLAKCKTNHEKTCELSMIHIDSEYKQNCTSVV